MKYNIDGSWSEVTDLIDSLRQIRDHLKKLGKAPYFQTDEDISVLEVGSPLHTRTITKLEGLKNIKRIYPVT